MYAGYVGFMLCKSSLPLFATTIKNGDLGLTTSDFGVIFAWGMAGALVGKLLTGMVADRLGGRNVFVLALVLTIATAVAFGAVSTRSVFSLLSFVVQFTKSAAWPSMAHLIKSWFPVQKYGRVWGIISTSSRLSAVLSALLVAALLLVLPPQDGWRWGFVVIGGIVALIVVLLLLFLKGKPANVGLASPQEERLGDTNKTKTASHPLDDKTLLDALAIFATSGRVWLICLSVMFLTVMMEFWTLIPQYLEETFHLTDSAAVGYSAAFPAGSFASMLVGGFVYDKLTKRGVMGVLSASLVIATGCVAFLWLLPNPNVNATTGIVPAIVAIFLLGTAISPAYYLPMSVFSIQFGGKHCGVLIGLIDACGYGLAIVFFLVGSDVAQQYGWSSLLAILVVVSVVSLIVTTLFLYVDLRNSLKTSTTK
jgi:sugar phosphate permease